MDEQIIDLYDSGDMKKTEQREIQVFLDGLSILPDDHYKCVTGIRELIFNVVPDATEKFMYGGIVFFNQGKMFSGVFSYNDHVTIEFSNGYLMKDPDNILEGKGKFRRHIKIKKEEEIIEKNVGFYISQAS
jgi:hypothetical protein